MARRALGPLYLAGRLLWHAARPEASRSAASPPPEVPESAGCFEALNVHVVHFPYQNFIRCALPTVYNPHDLQHLHYPQLFTREQIEWRETVYRAGCNEAAAVVADSHWAKRDIAERYGISPDKVYAVWPGPATELYPEPTPSTLTQVRRKFRLPDIFALYPAQTWPHKNHIRLLEALALLRDKDGLALHVICTGRKNQFWPKIETRLRELRLEQHVRFPGFVHATEIRALYRMAQFVIFPSLFEGAGLPVIEAFAEGAPVACSSAASLSEYAADAALLFDPSCVQGISQALHRMTSDAGVRAELRARGAERARLFSWRRAARIYRAIYRKVADASLTDEDAGLLREALMLEGGQAQ
jgi:glycosyltransferase involved in cell wall biosynthesis